MSSKYRENAKYIRQVILVSDWPIFKFGFFSGNLEACKVAVSGVGKITEVFV